MPEGTPSPEQVRAALDELLGWQGISRSPQLSELLRYVVEKTLGGDAAAIKAYAIAVDVFGRPATFDPQADPIVRVQARRLRTLIEQFYETGQGRGEVEIRLPLGRYVPEFSWRDGSKTPAAQPAADKAADDELMPVPPGVSPHGAVGPAGPLRGYMITALIGLSFTVIGVALAVAIIRLTVPTAFVPQQSDVPVVPQILMGSFDNLTGNGALDGLVRGFAPKLTTALGKFDIIRVGSEGVTLSGAVQENNGHFTVRAQLGGSPSNGIVWSATVSPDGADPQAVLDAAVIAIAAQLGSSSGPLHAPGRAWLKAQKALPDPPAPYVCALQFMVWRDSRKLPEAERGIDCFNKLLAQDGDNALALAASAGLMAWRTQLLASPTDDLVKAMADTTTQAARAVTIRPDRSFVYEQEGLVLARQGSLDAAIGAVTKAVEINPANADAVAVEGVLRWLNGDFAGGAALGEAAISAVPSPPPYFYMTRAFNALREQRYFDAIDAGQALAAGDEELGPVIALAAAPGAARNDLIDRYRPLVMDNPRFQAVGILPRVGMTLKPPVILERIRDGLTLAGIPPNALTGPFNPDGTPKR